MVSGFAPSTMSITLTPADYVPAGTGVVVTGSANATYNVPIAATDKVWANMLVGVTKETPIAATDGSSSNFVLTDGSYGYNWYAATGNTLAVGEAYLTLPTRSVGNNANARAFNWVFVDEDPIPTGIEDLITPDTVDDDAWYTLNGVRLAGKPTARGIYVNRGKKQVIK